MAHITPIFYLLKGDYTSAKLQDEFCLPIAEHLAGPLGCPYAVLDSKSLCVGFRV